MSHSLGDRFTALFRTGGSLGSLARTRPRVQIADRASRTRVVATVGHLFSSSARARTPNETWLEGAGSAGLFPVLRRWPQLIVVVLLWSCSADPRRAPDALPYAPRCGNGVIDRLSGAPALDETCDEGEGNGGPNSLCTLTCKDAHVRWFPAGGPTTLPFPARKLVRALPDYLVISNFDDNGIALVPIENVAAPVLLKKYSAPSSFEVGKWDFSDAYSEVMWVERPIPGVGGPWLLWTKIGEQPAPVIRELPDPVANGRAGTFLLEENYGRNGFADTDANGNLHRVLVSEVQPAPSMSDVDIGPSPPGTLSLVRKIPGIHGYRAIYFFANGPTTNVIAATDPVDTTSLPVVEWAGTWPRAVEHMTPGLFTNEVAPDQAAVLSPEGSVDIWAFHGAIGEVPPPHYGDVPAGSQNIAAITSGESILTVSPQGDLVLLMNNGNGRSLKPQYLHVGQACNVCTIAETSGHAPEWFAFDNLVIHGGAGLP
jgi:hypothetical protein